MKRKGQVLCLLILAAASTAISQPSNRIALVIGVQNYQKIKPLRHPLNDAEDIAAALKGKGFHVELLKDPRTKTQIREAILRYYNLMRTKTGAVGIVYYAGHGVQSEKGENYLIPADANIQLPGDLDDQCVKMNTVMSVLNSSNNLNVLLLDACRTNSLPSFGRDMNEGLAKESAPEGSIVFFATQPGKVASDGTGRNGLFTAKLLKYIDEPGLSMSQIFNNVKQGVYLESGKAQLPSLEDNSVGGSFYFDKGSAASSVKDQPKKEESSVSAQELFDKGLTLYNKENYAEALGWFSQAAKQGNSDAQNYLGVMYAKGYGVVRNDGAAVELYRKSAEQGHKFAQNNLGSCYLNGTGIQKDYAEALRWFRKSVEQELSVAQANLGWMYAYGLGVEKDPVEAVSWYRKAAEQGLADAQHSLGFSYLNGVGVEKDYTEALNWFSKAAAQSQLDSESAMGYMYYNGFGVKKDYEEAFKWYNKAASHGHAAAQSDLGIMLENGQGTAKSDELAIEMYRKAAAQGNKAGQENLDRLLKKQKEK